jgi:acyl carrier protein
MRFEDLAAKHLQIPREKVADHLRPEDVEDWDSLNYLLFMGALEKRYHVKFTVDDVLNAASLGDVRRLLRDRGVDA